MRCLPLSLVLCCLTLAGCASRPDEASIFVQTTPPGAECTLTRDGQQIAIVAPTPGIAVVAPAASDVLVECRRSGFREGSFTVHARKQDAGFGDLLNGGIAHYGYENPSPLVLRPQ